MNRVMINNLRSTGIYLRHRRAPSNSRPVNNNDDTAPELICFRSAEQIDFCLFFILWFYSFKQFKAIHDYATKEISTTLKLHANLCHVGNWRWCCVRRLQCECLLCVYIVRIEWLAMQQLAGRIVQRDKTVFASETALELNGNRTDRGRFIEQNGYVLRSAL